MSQPEPSEKVIEQMLPSVKECGKPVPVRDRRVPPKGFKSVFGETLVRVRGTVMEVASTGIRPYWSLTWGSQVPATGITVQVKVVLS